MTPTTHSTLLERLREDDVQAWEEFSRSYRPFLMTVARRLGLRGQDVDEVVQGAMVDFYRARKTFTYDRGRGRFRNYLKKALLSRLLKMRRQAQRQKELAESLSQARERPSDWDEKCEAVWEQEYRRQAVLRALERVRPQIQPKTYEVFDLYVVQEVDAREVAERLNVSTATVYTCKSRVLERLKPVLLELMEE